MCKSHCLQLKLVLTLITVFRLGSFLCAFGLENSSEHCQGYPIPQSCSQGIETYMGGSWWMPTLLPGNPSPCYVQTPTAIAMLWRVQQQLIFFNDLGHWGGSSENSVWPVSAGLWLPPLLGAPWVQGEDSLFIHLWKIHSQLCEKTFLKWLVLPEVK